MNQKNHNYGLPTILSGIGLSAIYAVGKATHAIPQEIIDLLGFSSLSIVSLGLDMLLFPEQAEKPKQIDIADRIKISLHNHSEFSDYSTNYSKIPVLLREAFKQLTNAEKPGVLAITDTSNDFLYRNFQKILSELPSRYALDYYSDRLAIIRDRKTGNHLYLLHAIEFHEPEGHILGIGINRQPKIYNSPIDNAKQVKEMDGIAIAAHPFAVAFGGCGKQKLDELIEKELIDAVEVHNSQCIRLVPYLIDAREYNKLAKQYALETGIPAIATSDSRHPKDIATSLFCPEQAEINFSSEEKFIASLKKAISESRFPKKYYEMNKEGYCSWLLFLRTLVSLNQFGRRFPWRKKSKGELIQVP